MHWPVRHRHGVSPVVTAIRHDIDDTIAFLNRYYKDHGPYGGYYSHVDPVTFDAKATHWVSTKPRRTGTPLETMLRHT